MKWRYEFGTATVRTVPENYCVIRLASFAEGGSSDPSIGDLNAIGNLIAAAPDMLQELERLHKLYPEDTKLKKTIDKAPGRLT
jgi:hypothetical protein